MGAAGDMLMGALLELLSPKEKEEFLEELKNFEWQELRENTGRT